MVHRDPDLPFPNRPFKCWKKASSHGDVDGVMAMYWNSPDLVSYPPDAMEAHGWRAVRDDLRRFFDSVSGAKLELLETNYKVAGDVVFGGENGD
ncbi:MAG: YybH family protein [bacterium]